LDVYKETPLLPPAFAPQQIPEADGFLFDELDGIVEPV
jgi:hypothetical protein